MTPDDDPLILTLSLDPESFAYFDSLRQAHFPPERNFLRAHLTVFHALPGRALPDILDRLAAVTARTPPLELAVTEVRFLGRGCAFGIESAAAQRLRAGLAEGWSDWLTPQDAQKWRPHVTVQNKVPADAAKAVLAQLRSGFEPFGATGTGLALWHYRGGPWDAAAAMPFRGPSAGGEEPEAET